MQCLIAQNSIKDIASSEYPTTLNDVHDVQQGVTYDSYTSSGESYDYEAVLSETEAHATAAVAETTVTSSHVAPGMDTSTYSDTTDTTLIDIKGKELSLEELHSLTVSASTSSHNVPFEQYGQNDDVSKPRSRHGSGNEPSGVRRGSFNFVPHKGHLLSRSSLPSSGSESFGAGGGASGGGGGGASNSESQTSGGSEVFESGASATDRLDAQTSASAIYQHSMSGIQFTAGPGDDTLMPDDQPDDDYYSRVEGTMDPEISRDAMLLRQLSMELTREREAAAERQRFTEVLAAVVVVLAVVVIGGFIIGRRKQ